MKCKFYGGSEASEGQVCNLNELHLTRQFMNLITSRLVVTTRGVRYGLGGL